MTHFFFCLTHGPRTAAHPFALTFSKTQRFAFFWPKVVIPSYPLSDVSKRSPLLISLNLGRRGGPPAPSSFRGADDLGRVTRDFPCSLLFFFSSRRRTDCPPGPDVVCIFFFCFCFFFFFFCVFFFGFFFFCFFYSLSCRAITISFIFFFPATLGSFGLPSFRQVATLARASRPYSPSDMLVPWSRRGTL